MFYEDDVNISVLKEEGREERSTASLAAGYQSFARRGSENELGRWLTVLRSPEKLPQGISTPSQARLSDSVAEPANQTSRSKDSQTLSQALISEASLRFAAYLKGERERYWSQGRGLNENARAQFGRFFSDELLKQVRVVVLSGRRVTNPALFHKANGLGLLNLPDLTHKASVTFLDVIVFNERITDRELFHALVQAAQAHVLGAKSYAELFVQGVIRARSFSLAPMQAQAFALDARFAADEETAFSVEDEVREWMKQGRY